MAQKGDRRIEGVKAFFVILIILYLFTGLWVWIDHLKITLEDARAAQKADLAFNRDDVVLDYFFDRLWFCESSSMPDVVHLDTDHKWVYGPIQFKQDTFNTYGTKYALRHDDILNPIQQKAIFKAMAKDGLWYKWAICSKKIGLDKWKPIYDLARR